MFAAIGLAILGHTPGANAATITGIITFGEGEGTYNAGHTAITAITAQPRVMFASGDFAALIGSTATFQPFSFDSGPVSSLWSVGAFTFNLTSGKLTSPTPFLIMTDGVGTITAPGFLPTNGIFAFIGIPGTLSTSFTFTAAAAALGASAVPDGGTTVAFLGLALLGLHAAHRKSVKA